MNTAAEAAKYRRSISTGMLRVQPQGAIDPEHLSFLFGGSAKPKLATEKVNVLKEKEKAVYNKGMLKKLTSNDISTKDL